MEGEDAGVVRGPWYVFGTKGKGQGRWGSGVGLRRWRTEEGVRGHLISRMGAMRLGMGVGGDVVEFEREQLEGMGTVELVLEVLKGMGYHEQAAVWVGAVWHTARRLDERWEGEEGEEVDGEDEVGGQLEEVWTGFRPIGFRAPPRRRRGEEGEREAFSDDGEWEEEREELEEEEEERTRRNWTEDS